MQLSSAGRSDIGRKRDTNEDFHVCVNQRGLYLVADGLGGHVAGNIASETAASAFVENLYLNSGESRAEALRRACRQANRTIQGLTDADDRLWGMGTTLLSLWLQDGYAALAHVGDSRAYVYRDQLLQRLTYDHSVVGELALKRELTPEHARQHPHRHVIKRALGVPGCTEPDLLELRVRDGDLFMLCTDGLTAQLGDNELAEVICEARGQLERAAERMIGLANERGGEDNSTVVLVDVGGIGER